VVADRGNLGFQLEILCFRDRLPDAFVSTFLLPKSDGERTPLVLPLVCDKKEDIEVAQCLN
jgi:hypothetical protein